MTSKKWQIYLTGAALALTLNGCLVKETLHTLYLEPDGALTWMVVEKDIRSDKKDADERDAEELLYLDQFVHSTDPLTRALEHLGGRVDTRWLRAKRPYMTLREARFDSLETALEALFEVYVPGQMELEETATEKHLRLLFREDEDTEDMDDTVSEEFLALLDGSHRIVLSEGRFVDARGFRLEDEDTAAVLDLEELEDADESGVLELRLSWTNAAHQG